MARSTSRRQTPLKRRAKRPSRRSVPKYRVFISYSHGDLALVKEIDSILRRNGMSPMWDKSFVFGHGFHEQIKNFIAHAHVFLPVLTRRADERKWVHQEIGFATALNIPVLPIAVGKLPGELLQEIHALQVQRKNVHELRSRLTVDAIKILIEGHAAFDRALYVCADSPEERATLMAAYANDVFALGERDLVRQKGALSSFHMPSETVGHPVWSARYGKKRRSIDHCRRQRAERLALGRHAEFKGCRLIINPFLKFEEYGPAARLVRLQAICSFLRGMTDKLCEVVTHHWKEHGESVTLLGDWFAAESVSAEVGKGYRQTVFTRHAPTLMDKIAEFDAEFDELLRKQGVSRSESRRHAIGVIEAEIAKVSAGLEAQSIKRPRAVRQRGAAERM